MPSVFLAPDREVLLQGLARLRPDSPYQWGRMDPAQMLRHCNLAFEPVTGERPMPSLGP